MKNILLIGLGRFGRHIAIQLSQLGHDIMAIDTDEERVNDILPFVTNAQIGDSTNPDFLKSLGIGNFDICFVTISGSFQNSLETTSLLKELGGKLVISRAERDVQEKFLLRNGADKVIYPEKPVATGPPSDIPMITFWTIWRWMLPTLLSKLKFLPAGLAKQSVNWISVKNIISILWLLKATEKLICLSQQTLCLPIILLY